MKKIFLFLSLNLLLINAAVFARSKNYYTYDYKSGNTYYSSGSGYRGYNYKTGSSWYSNYNSIGSWGMDARGNNWRYDRNTGSYFNYRLGEMRYKGKRW